MCDYSETRMQQYGLASCPHRAHAFWIPPRPPPPCATRVHRRDQGRPGIAYYPQGAERSLLAHRPRASEVTVWAAQGALSRHTRPASSYAHAAHTRPIPHPTRVRTDVATRVVRGASVAHIVVIAPLKAAHRALLTRRAATRVSHKLDRAQLDAAPESALPLGRAVRTRAAAFSSARRESAWPAGSASRRSRP